MGKWRMWWCWSRSIAKNKSVKADSRRVTTGDAITSAIAKCSKERCWALSSTMSRSVTIPSNCSSSATNTQLDRASRWSCAFPCLTVSQIARIPLIWAIASITVVSGETTKGSRTIAALSSAGVRAVVRMNMIYRVLLLFIPLKIRLKNLN